MGSKIQEIRKMERKTRYIKLVMLISPFVFLTGCLEFESVEQPSSVLPDEVFTVFIEVTREDWDVDVKPYFGIRLPNGWTVPGDAIPCTGAYSGTIIYDSDLALEQESLSPSPEEYTWWVGAGDTDESEHGSAYAEVQIQTDHQAGRFSLDYMVGIELNEDRSDEHLIELVDEVTPREPQAVVQGNTISLSWRAAFVSEGLIGYDVYRDGQIINTDLVVDTVYIDENPTQGLTYYTISSLYDNGDVYLMPYEISVLVFSGGTGDPNDPYRITAPVQLASFSIADFPYLLDKCFVLGNDLDLDPNLPGGQVFDRAVIAPDISELRDDFRGTAFTGTFDGSGFRISNLTIVGQDHLGLIGAIHDGSQVLNLGIVDASVFGTGSGIGILAGDNGGYVSHCYSTGSVGGNKSVGGLLGGNESTVSYCYSTGLVSGDELVGGLVGNNGGAIDNCYSTGSVSGVESVGGLVGTSYGDVSHSFWDVETSGQTQSGGGVGLTTTEMMNPEFIGLNGWADDPNWILDSNHDYPHLTWEATPGQSIPEPIIDWMEGMGTTDNPYEIMNADQLVMMGKASILWDRHFVLSADISLIGKTWPMPVIPKFWGTFEGNGFTISELTIVGGNRLGLFGQLKEDARIMNLSIVDASVFGTGSDIGILAGDNAGDVTHCYSTGSVSGDTRAGGLVGRNRGYVNGCYNVGTVSGDTVGGLVGWNDGDVINSYSTGTVRGRWEVGGLAGSNDGSIATSYSTGSVSGDRRVGGLMGNNGGTIDNCSSTGAVNGQEYVGGLVGRNNGDVTNSYSTGSVSGHDYVGGLVGENDRGNVGHSYSMGSVSGESEVGGLVGSNDRGSIATSFWDMETSGLLSSDGGIGKTTSEMQTANTFLDGGWDFMDETENGTEDIWWINEGQDYPRLWWERGP